MPYENEEEEIIVRNGTIRQFLSYTIKGTKVKGWHIVLAALVVGVIVGAAL